MWAGARQELMKLISKIRQWLGLGEGFIGVDVSSKDEACVIVSRLKNGQARVMDVRFGSRKESELFVKQTQRRYGISDEDVVCEGPGNFKPFRFYTILLKDEK